MTGTATGTASGTASGTLGGAGTATGSGAPETVVGPGADAVWRRLRWPLAVAFVVLVAAALLGLAGAGGQHGELDPAAADPAGSRALATLLADRGVRVDRVTTVSAAAGRAGPDSGRDATLVVPFPGRMPAGQLDRLARAYSDGRLVLVAPGRRALAGLHTGITPRGDVPVSRRDPDCDLPAAGIAGNADLGGTVYRPAGGTGCYPAPGGVTLVVAGSAGAGQLVVLGSGDLLQNQHLDRAGNAALGMLLLAGDDPGGADGAGEVVWLVSGPGSAATSSSGLTDIAPRWMLLGLGQLLLACLVVALWRGRRLGPPVTEPLPVVVRAAETVEGRARLYRRAGARVHAAGALRAGALARLVPRLGLGTDPPPAAVVAAVSARTSAAGYGAGPEVGALLFGPPPADDAGLVRLADQLDALVAVTLAGGTISGAVSGAVTGAVAAPAPPAEKTPSDLEGKTL